MTPAPRALVACDAVAEALPALLAGEREAEVLGLDASAIEAHLADCAACRAERDAAARVRGWLAAAAPAEPAEATDGLGRLLATVQATPQDGTDPISAAAPVAAAAHPPRPAAVPGGWRTWLATAAAAALVAGTALSVGWLDLGGSSPRTDLRNSS